jgi:cobalt-precorrin-5B (C1)-methyltransferase
MVGKFSKLAQGHFMTHVAGNQVDLVFLATIAAECGAPGAVQDEIRAANTARHFQEIALTHGLRGVFDRIAQDVRTRSLDLVEQRLRVTCLLFDFDGTILGSAGWRDA